MNAAFLLMTSALLVGQPGSSKAPSPATPAPVASSCSSDCGCEGFGHRLRGLFKRDCDSCAPAKCETACHTKCERAPLFHSRCKDACAPKWHWEPKCREPKCREPKCHAPKCCAPKCCTPKCCAPKACAPAPCCDACERQGFLAKLRERFQRHDHCCDSGCAPAAPGKKIEKIDTPPKKLDKGKGEEVQFESRSTPNVIQVAPSAPSVEVVPVPAPAPRISGDRRDPF